MRVNDPLLRFRDRFPVLGTSCYLVSHSLGAMATASADELARYSAEWGTRGVRAWEEGWWETPLSVGDELAPLLGAPAGSVAMVQNVTIAEAVIASALPVDPDRNRVVFSDRNFPSVGYVWHGMANFEVRVVRSWDGITVPTETFIQAIDERTAVVPLSHTLFKSAYVQDVAAITERAHEVGAVVIADFYQSAGVMPIDVFDLGVDFAVGGSVKWLIGGPGAGWLYVRPDLQDQYAPTLVGWQADSSPFDFRQGPIDHADGMWRWLSGTPNVPALYAARAGYRIVAEAGIDAIRDKSLRQTQWLIDLGDELEIPIRSERRADRRGGTVTFGVDDEGATVAALARRGVIVDARPGAGIRVGPHFYNSQEDLDQFGEAIREAIRA